MGNNFLKKIITKKKNSPALALYLPLGNDYLWENIMMSQTGRKYLINIINKETVS